MARKITMDDIAEHAHVSKYAVSKALSGQSGVSEQTRQKIQAIAYELGYFKQRRVQFKYSGYVENVRGIANDTEFAKRSIMVLMPNIRMQTMDSHYWGRIIDGIADELKKHNLFMIIVSANSDDNLTSLINVKELLGVIVVGTISSSMLQSVGKTTLPIVMVDHEDPAFLCDTLFVDNIDAASRMTNHLLGLGHTYIQFVGDIHFARSFQERFIGFRTAMEEKQLMYKQDEKLIQINSLDVETSKLVLGNYFDECKQGVGLPTGFMCANDDIAILVMQVARQKQLSVPDQLSVTGFDNIDESEYIVPALTTMHVDKETLGRRAVEMLIRRLGNPQAAKEKVLLQTELISRDSVSLCLQSDEINFT